MFLVVIVVAVFSDFLLRSALGVISVGSHGDNCTVDVEGAIGVTQDSIEFD